MSHLLHTYQDPLRLAGTVAEYLTEGLARGEAAVIIARPGHAALIENKISVKAGQLTVLDAQATLDKFMAAGMPQWKPFHELIGGLIAGLRLQYPGVRAYGEMVDILWQQGRREAAIRLEEYWNELARLQTFSLFCAYGIDHLDPASYAGLQSVCATHTHFIPACDAKHLDEAVVDASRRVLDDGLAELLLSLAQRHRQATEMPLGQATLFWLAQNMPRTAEKVLNEVRASTAAR